MAVQTLDIPIAHIEDAASVLALIKALCALHGPDYDFAIGRWDGPTRFEPQAGRVSYRFVIESHEGRVSLAQGSLVRGPSPAGPYRSVAGPLAEVTKLHTEPLWPGDLVSVDGRAGEALTLNGRGVYFEVTTGQTSYRAPTLAMLRYLPDRPGGCAAYPGAFRRETLPPQRPAPGAEDRRGPNRVNEHTLDMRFDQHPSPIRHYHGQVSIGAGRKVNHSETAIVLPRSVYNLPEVKDRGEEGHIVIYRRPAEDPSDRLIIPIHPGSIVVTPATAEGVMGHCFENAFAMLVAIPGFVAPYNLIKE
jgi:hypothetical protein